MVLKHERKTLGHTVVFLLFMLASPAISKDFGILIRMLYVAFLAEQDMAVCIVADPAFTIETSRPMGLHARLRAARQSGGHGWPK
jgi:hypothetical protein